MIPQLLTWGFILAAVALGIWGALENARKRGAAEERNKVLKEDVQQEEENRARTEKVAEAAANPPSNADTIGRLRDGQF